MLTINGYILWVRIVTLTFPDCELSTLDWSENWFLTCSSFHPSVLMTIKGYILWVRIVTLTFPDCDLSTLDWSENWFIRPCSLFPIDNLSIYAQNFFKFCIHIVIGDEWYGIVNGQNPTIFDGVTALSPFKKWFLACFSFTVYDIWMKLHRYVEQQRLHITTKDRHSYLSSSWVICPWLILSISVLLLFRHYISHKITFGAPSSGGVLCSACGAFISRVNSGVSR